MKTKQAIQALSSLAQESRLSVFRLLVQTGEGGLSAGEISDRLNIPPATLSFHLKELTATGLIAPTRQSRSLVYALQPIVMNELMQFLIQDCCQGRPELCQTKSAPSQVCCGTGQKSAKPKKVAANRDLK